MKPFFIWKRIPLCAVLFILSILCSCRQPGTELEHNQSAPSQPVIIQEDSVQVDTSTSEASAVSSEEAEAADWQEAEEAAPVMEVHFIDLGQSDATLIRNGDHAMLVDAGDNEHGIALQLYLMRQGIGSLDYLLLTHPDADHTGGADVVIGRGMVQQVLLGDCEKESGTFQDVLNSMEKRGLTGEKPELGSIWKLGDAQFTVTGPCEETEESNDASICILIQKGDRSFLFTGDAGHRAEESMVDAGMEIKADVLQAGHHGSIYSSSEQFLDVVSPVYAVISCGRGNRYGYPHETVLNRLQERNIKVFRTDEQGSVVAYCDGKQITWSCEPSDTWQSGEDGCLDGEANISGLPQGELLTVVNKKTGVVHRSDCETLPSAFNQILFETLEEAEEAGYSRLCGNCLGKNKLKK